MPVMEKDGGPSHCIGVIASFDITTACSSANYKGSNICSMHYNIGAGHPSLAVKLQCRSTQQIKTPSGRQPPRLDRQAEGHSDKFGGPQEVIE